MDLGSVIIVLVALSALVYVLAIHPMVMEVRRTKRAEYLLEWAQHFSYRKLGFGEIRRSADSALLFATVDTVFHFRVEIQNGAVTQIRFDDSNDCIEISYLPLSRPDGKMGTFVSYSPIMNDASMVAMSGFEVPLVLYVNISKGVKAFVGT